MLSIRTADISDDIHQKLDGFREDDGILASSYVALALYGCPDRLADILSYDPADDVGGWFFRDGQKCRYLTDYASTLIRQLSPRQQRSVVAFGLREAPEHIRQLACFYCEAQVQDAIVGGYSSEYRPLAHCRSNNTLDKRFGSHFSNRKVIRTFIRGDRETHPHNYAIFRSFAQAPWPECLTEAEHVEALNKEHIRPRLLSLQKARFQRLLAFETTKRAFPKHVKRGIKRAAGLVEDHCGSDVLSSFVGNEPVVVRGRLLTWRLRKGYSIATEGHGALRIDLHDNDSNGRVASLCLYFPDVPTLDQLVAVTLFVRADEEMKLLTTGNLFDPTPALSRFEWLKECRVANNLPGDLQRARLAISHYADMYLDRYIEIIEHQLFGKNVFAYRRLVSALPQ